MQHLAENLALFDIEVWRFNFSYMQGFVDTGKRTFPAKMPVLCQQFNDAISHCPADLPLFIGGKSMGGRVATLLSLRQNIKAIFAFGYPFHPLKKHHWRTEHFAELVRPLYIIQGERDAFGSKSDVSGKNWPQVETLWLPDGDHDFKPRQKSGWSQLQLMTQAAEFCSRKIDEILLANQ